MSERERPPLVKVFCGGFGLCGAGGNVSPDVHLTDTHLLPAASLRMNQYERLVYHDEEHRFCMFHGSHAVPHIDGASRSTLIFFSDATFKELTERIGLCPPDPLLKCATAGGEVGGYTHGYRVVGPS